MKILLSDPHFQPFRDRKFESQEKNWIEVAIIWLEIIPHYLKTFFAFTRGKKIKILNREEKIFLAMQRIVKEEHISLCVSNGDFSESLCTEQGMRTAEDLKVAFALRERFKQKTGIVCLEENAGNHELGYNLPLCTDPGAGIYQEGINNFLKLTDRKELYHSFIAEDFKVIMIPYLFSEGSAVDFDIKVEKEEFLHKFKKDMVEDIPVIIFIHDPDSFNDINLLKIIRENREKIKFIFYGHYHTQVNLFATRILINIHNREWLLPVRWIFNLLVWIFAKGDMHIVRELGRYFRKRKNTPALIKELDAILIPAPTGMYGLGGGLGVLNLSGDGSYRIEKLKI